MDNEIRFVYAYTFKDSSTKHFDIRLADMTSKRRPQSIAVPRQPPPAAPTGYAR